jgi:hypothetical protein
MATELMPHSGIVTGGGGHAAWGARVSVEAGSAVQAVTRAAAIVAWSAAKTGLPAWPVVRAEATREDVLNLELSARRREGLQRRKRFSQIECDGCRPRLCGRPWHGT